MANALDKFFVESSRKWIETWSRQADDFRQRGWLDEAAAMDARVALLRKNPRATEAALERVALQAKKAFKG